MDKLLFKRIIIALLALLVISYLVYLFMGAKFGNSVETEEAVYTTVSDVIYSRGYIIRDESYLSNDQKGVLSYNVSDGDKISVGQNIADIYSNEKDALTHQKIKKLDSRIDRLKTLSESYYKNSISLETVDSQIGNNLFSIMSDVTNGNLMKAKSRSDNLLMTVCERQLITGDVKDFSSKISELKKQKSKLEAESSDVIGSLSSDTAGYFISYTDGYENSFDYNSPKRITVKKLAKAKPQKVSKNIIGRVVANPVWYIACEITPDDVISLSKIQSLGEKIYVNMPSVTNVSIPTTIYSINQDDPGKNGVLILSCDYMNNYIAGARNEDVEITAISYSGLKVSKRAVHEGVVEKRIKHKDGTRETKTKHVQGVYVLHGSELIFKEISIIYSAPDYVLCDAEPGEGTLFNGETVELYDQVVIKGDNLYDGKVIS